MSDLVKIVRRRVHIFRKYVTFAVTPCVGVWIEILQVLMALQSFLVTPCVGVWIEIDRQGKNPGCDRRSLLAWECGLK